MEGQLSERILLVDDDSLIRKLISGYLVATGYVVRTAVDGLDALGKLRAGHTDMIISDLNMPRMSGFEFLAIVRKRLPHIPVIVISSVAAEEMPEGVAADAYFHKTGYGFEKLLDTVSDLARKPLLRTFPPTVDNDPVQATWDGKGHYIIACKDCFREFSVLRIFHSGRDEKQTICVHCGKITQFLVADGEPVQ